MNFSTIQLVELGLIGVFYLIFGYGLLRQHAHLRDVPFIEDEATMNAYRGFVRTQMYLSVAGYGLLIPIVIAIFAEGEGFSTLEGIVCWVPLGAMFVFDRFTKRLEAGIQDPDRVAPMLRNEFDAVTVVWRKKLLPSF